VLLPYLTATLIDHTPENPLDLWALGSYTLRVKSGRVEVGEEQLNGALGSALKDLNAPVKDVAVSLLDGNRVGAKLKARVAFLPVPVSLRAGLEAFDSKTLLIKPESIKVMGVPVAGLSRLLRLDVPKLLGMPAGGPVSAAPGGALRVDLSKVPILEGDLTGLKITRGRASVIFGAAPDAVVSSARRNGNANWAEVISKGEALLETGIIRNARVVITDNTPQDPYSLNRWDLEGLGVLERGEVILPEKLLVEKFGSAGGEGFYMESVTLQGTDLAVVGKKEILGFPIPVAFKLAFQKASDGKLLLTPHSVRVAGLKFGKDQIISAMKSMPGISQRGDSLVLDLKVAASVVMPPLRSVSAEPGRVVLTPDL
jgi:hypothetical protein